jgi:ElaB/YqjD/DUF883 family membrane-anchored ribosome-binding protein
MVDRVMADAKQKLQPTAEHLEEIGAHVREIGSILKDTVEQKIADIRDGAVEIGRASSDRAGEARDNLEKYIRKQPMKSILIAAGAGALLSILIRRN